MIASELNCKMPGLSIMVPISYMSVQEKKRKILRHVLFCFFKKNTSDKEDKISIKTEFFDDSEA